MTDHLPSNFLLPTQDVDAPTAVETYRFEVRIAGLTMTEMTDISRSVRHLAANNRLWSVVIKQTRRAAVWDVRYSPSEYTMSDAAGLLSTWWSHALDPIRDARTASRLAKFRARQATRRLTSRD